MGKSKGDIQQVLETFSFHMEQKHSSPDKFIKGIKALLDAKRKRDKKDDYVKSLEKNVIYLYYFVEGAKAILELMTRRINDDEKFLQLDPGLTISELEARVREKISGKEGEGYEMGEFSEIINKESTEPHSYIQNLEFNYSYLMAARGFMVDFINLLYALQREYYIEDVNSSTGDNIWNYIDMIANYYIGNIKIGKGNNEESYLSS
jgi:hypothetical protein